MNNSFSYKIDKIILLIIFGLAIYIPLFTSIFQTDQLSSSSEKRKLATLPPAPNSIKTLNKFPQAFNSYYSDHFGLREQYTALYSSLLYQTQALHAINEVTFGQDGWMFLGDIEPGPHKYDDPMGDAINKNLFSKEQLQNFAQSITAVKQWLKNRGVEYIFVIAPNKHSIYFDKMPSFISKQNEYSATDQLVAYLQKHTDVNVVDLRPALLEEKKNHQVYFKADTHWTHYGANAAQFEIMKKVQSLFPKQEVKPIFLQDDQFKILTKTNGDLANFTKIGKISEKLAIPVFNPGCTVKKDPSSQGTFINIFSCQSQGLKAVIFGDSFLVFLQNYISGYFKRSIYIPTKINYNLLNKYINLEKPDIIIEEIVERKLPYIPTADFINNLP